MNILLICGSDHQYGSAKAAINLLKMQDIYEDIRFIVCTQTYGVINEICSSNGILNYVVDYRYCVYSPEKNPIFSLAKRIIKQIIVYRHNTNAIKEIEKLIDMHSIDIIHTNMDRDLVGVALAEKFKIPHVMHLREYLKGHYNVKPLFSNQIKYIDNRTQYFIAISQAVKNNWRQFGLSVEKIVPIYDGVDTENIVPHDFNIENEDLHVIMCGDISVLKGEDQLISAISLLDAKVKKHIFVDFFGEAKKEKEYLLRLQKFVIEKNLEGNIHFCGYSDNIGKVLQNYEVGVVCSKNEGFGLATAEFMTAQLCPVVSDTGANVELVDNNRSGLIYKYNNISDLAKCLEYLYIHPLERKKMAKLARTKALKKFSNEENERNVYFLYKRILGD